MTRIIGDTLKLFGAALLFAATIAGPFIALFAWFTHIYRCLTEEQWGYLIAGAIFFPIAIFHGFGIWLGAW